MIKKELDKAGMLFMQKLYEGHPGCKFKIGDKIIKIRHAKSDVHNAGTIGVVTGCWKEDLIPEEAYMVRFTGDAQDVFITGTAITLDLTIKDVVA